MSWTSTEQCPCDFVFCLKLSNFVIIFAAACFLPIASVKITCHKANDIPTSSASSKRDSTFIQNHFLHCFNVFNGCWHTRVTRMSIFIDIFRVFLKLVILYLNLGSAYSRLAKHNSQHFKCPWTFNFILYTKLNRVSLIHFFGIESTPKHV